MPRYSARDISGGKLQLQASNPPPRPTVKECNTGASRASRTLVGVPAFSEVRDDSSMLVTGAPIGFGDPSQALSKAHVVMQCNAVFY